MKTNDRKSYEQPWTWWRVNVNYDSPLKRNEFFLRLIRGGFIIYFLVYLGNYYLTLSTNSSRSTLSSILPEQILSVGAKGEKYIKIPGAQVLIDENGVARLV